MIIIIVVIIIVINGSPWTPEVRTYGPDVDLALVEIEDSVAEDFWAGGLRRDGRVWGFKTLKGDFKRVYGLGF